MICFKKTGVLCFIFFLYAISSNVNAKIENRKFLGGWCWELNDDIAYFSIKIKEHTGIYKGSYDSIALRGRVLDENHSAFSFKTIENQAVITELTGSLTDSKGLVQLKLIEGDKMRWRIIKYPDGDIYVPREAILDRC